MKKLSRIFILLMGLFSLASHAADNLGDKAATKITYAAMVEMRGKTEKGEDGRCYPVMKVPGLAQKLSEAIGDPLKTVKFHKDNWTVRQMWGEPVEMSNTGTLFLYHTPEVLKSLRGPKDRIPMNTFMVGFAYHPKGSTDGFSSDDLFNVVVLELIKQVEISKPDPDSSNSGGSSGDE